MIVRDNNGRCYIKNDEYDSNDFLSQEYFQNNKLYWQNYLDGIDQVANKSDDLMEQFEQINDELEFQGELIELLYGEEAYNLLNNLYKGQERSLENQVQSVKAQADMWHQLWIDSGATMENQADWNEDQKQYYEQWGDAQEKLNELIVDYIKLLKEDYLNAVQGILKELEGAITGSSLDRVKIQWERISAYSDNFPLTLSVTFKFFTGLFL